MLRAYRIFLLLVMLAASIAAPPYFWSHAYWNSAPGPPLLVMTSCAGALAALYTLWIDFTPDGYRNRSVRLAYRGVISVIAVMVVGAGLYLLYVLEQDIAAGGFETRQLAMLIPSGLLVPATLHIARFSYLHPLPGVVEPDSPVIPPQSLEWLLFGLCVSLILTSLPYV
jgi:hypothetical protein